MNPAYPKGELDDFNCSYPISIQFASPSTINFIINTTMTTALEKSKGSPLVNPAGADMETANPGTKPASNIQTPFADLMLKPEKLDAALHAANITAPKGKPRSAKARKAHPTSNDSSNNLKPTLKNTEFQFTAPSAISVKLAADFTDWEKSPLDLTKNSDGVWSTLVVLLPGRYHYRFIVDGTWCNDPNCAELIPNAFGSGNSVIEISR
jgi:hypothetical protein